MIDVKKFFISYSKILQRWYKSGSSPKRVVDFRSDWALCSCRFAFATENICCCCRYAFAQIKQLLTLRFRADKTAALLSLRAELPGGVR